MIITVGILAFDTSQRALPVLLQQCTAIQRSNRSVEHIIYYLEIQLSYTLAQYYILPVKPLWQLVSYLIVLHRLNGSM